MSVHRSGGYPKELRVTQGMGINCIKKGTTNLYNIYSAALVTEKNDDSTSHLVISWWQWKLLRLMDYPENLVRPAWS